MLPCECNTLRVEIVASFIRFLTTGVVLLKSSNKHEDVYALDTSMQTCTCKSFYYRGRCDHLNDIPKYAHIIPQGYTQLKPEDNKDVYGMIEFRFRHDYSKKILDIHFDKWGYRVKSDSEYHYNLQDALSKALELVRIKDTPKNCKSASIKVDM